MRFLPGCLAYHLAPRFHTPRSTLIDALTFAVAFIVYLVTLQKDILPADSGEFQLVTTTLRGILHQPGYPLYTLVGKLFTLLPVGTPALRLNLMSVFLAAGTLTLVGATVRKMLGKSCGGSVGQPGGGAGARHSDDVLGAGHDGQHPHADGILYGVVFVLADRLSLTSSQSPTLQSLHLYRSLFDAVRSGVFSRLWTLFCRWRSWDCSLRCIPRAG